MKETKCNCCDEIHLGEAHHLHSHLCTCPMSREEEIKGRDYIGYIILNIVILVVLVLASWEILELFIRHFITHTI